MKHNALRVAGLPAALLVLTLGVGCATSGDVDAVKKIAEDASESDFF